jgi:hypothetical protein
MDSRVLEHCGALLFLVHLVYDRLADERLLPLEFVGHLYLYSKMLGVIIIESRALKPFGQSKSLIRSSQTVLRTIDIFYLHFNILAILSKLLISQCYATS